MDQQFQIQKIEGASELQGMPIDPTSRYFSYIILYGISIICALFIILVPFFIYKKFIAHNTKTLTRTKVILTTLILILGWYISHLLGIILGVRLPL